MTEAAHQMASNPLPPRAAQARQRRHRRRPGGGDHGRRRTAAAARRGRRDRHPRAERHRRLREQSGGQRARPSPTAGSAPATRATMDDGRLCPRHRPAQGDHQPRRREDLAARGRRGADGPPGDRAGRSPSPCRTTSSARKSPPRSCCARAPTATEREIRDFAADRLADFKVPRKIVILDEIPKGATGKLQRIGLAAKLGLG